MDQKIDYIIREAKPEEADKLTELCLVSKASWGYPKEWIEKWRTELTITPEIISNSIAIVAEKKEKIIGFWCRPKVDSTYILYGFLFIDPRYMGKGIAKKLYEELKIRLLAIGIESFVIEADPNAVPFYLKLGAEKIGEKESQSIQGRKIPILKFILK